MRVFFLAQRVPYPPDRGDKIITFNAIRHLARNHEVHVFCLADGEEDLSHVPELERTVASVKVVPVNKVKAKRRAALAFGRRRSFTVAYFREAALLRAVRVAAGSLNPDLYFVFSSGMAQYAEEFERTPRLMQFVDLDSLKWGQYASHTKWPMSAIYRLEARRLLEYERHIAATFDHSLVCTEREMSDFQRLIPNASVSCVRNGVDLDYFRRRSTERTPTDIIFTGVMNYFPNVDGVTWFCETVLPRVQEVIPGVRFTICGRSPTSGVIALKRHAGVSVTGAVSDVRPYLDRSGLAVVPLRMARGIQNKLLEAMAMSLPCVVTSAVSEGAGILTGSGVFVADDPAGFARGVIDLITDSELRATSSIRARAAVEAWCSWDSQFAKLDASVLSVVNGRSFVGAKNSAG